jgi:hypothetical protein
MHRRSRHIYASVALGLVALGVWGTSRLVLCWGSYGFFGKLLCHLNIVTYLFLCTGLVALVLLLRDLGRDEAGAQAETHVSRVQRIRAHLRGLPRSDRIHAISSTSLLLLGVAVLLWLVFLSPVRF